MPLPGDWDAVDWRPTVIILPTRTEGILSLPLHADRFPQFGRAYYMMATTLAVDPGLVGDAVQQSVVIAPQANERVILYNAGEVGTGGRLTSQFVFLA